jgi:hypothetical protein
MPKPMRRRGSRQRQRKVHTSCLRVRGAKPSPHTRHTVHLLRRDHSEHHQPLVAQRDALGLLIIIGAHCVSSVGTSPWAGPLARLPRARAFRSRHPSGPRRPLRTSQDRARRGRRALLEASGSILVAEVKQPEVRSAQVIELESAPGEIARGLRPLVPRSPLGTARAQARVRPSRLVELPAACGGVGSSNPLDRTQYSIDPVLFSSLARPERFELPTLRFEA